MEIDENLIRQFAIDMEYEYECDLVNITKYMVYNTFISVAYTDQYHNSRYFSIAIFRFNEWIASKRNDKIDIILNEIN